MRLRTTIARRLARNELPHPLRPFLCEHDALRKAAILLDNVLYRPAAQMANMMTMMAMNCRRTLSRISFCDLFDEPPRIMLARPSTSTTATAATAIGTRAEVKDMDHI